MKLSQDWWGNKKTLYLKRGIQIQPSSDSFSFSFPDFAPSFPLKPLTATNSTSSSKKSDSSGWGKGSRSGGVYAEKEAEAEAMMAKAEEAEEAPDRFEVAPPPQASSSGSANIPLVFGESLLA